ncbi:lipase maturation factor family protein [Archangium sp.]|uniref:lipase maturation factor family protein n=1 Tax=Archangium sp. TaxID=1872627 RepID=UPI002D50D5E4|nr:lipase maturation factor family protein [Archangium sp.]HYO59004.1 lipase maturation factor family protein [Archangium sp.]
MDDLADFRSINTYGLFAVMTTGRREIVLEGSTDGRTWKEYLLPYRPGRVDEAPHVVVPHQPRLDWPMWFAALSTCQGNPWLLRLQEVLLRGGPDVRRLFEGDPFPDAPPVSCARTSSTTASRTGTRGALPEIGGCARRWGRTARPSRSLAGGCRL